MYSSLMRTTLHIVHSMPCSVHSKRPVTVDQMTVRIAPGVREREALGGWVHTGTPPRGLARNVPTVGDKCSPGTLGHPVFTFTGTVVPLSRGSSAEIKLQKMVQLATVFKFLNDCTLAICIVIKNQIINFFKANKLNFYK